MSGGDGGLRGAPSGVGEVPDVTWRNGGKTSAGTRHAPSAELEAEDGGGILYSLNHQAEGTVFHHRPSSAPNYMTTFFAGLGQSQPLLRTKAGYGKVDMPALPGAAKKYNTDAIYRAPYFDLGHFAKKDGEGQPGGGVSQSQPHLQQRASKKVTTLRSREGSGSHFGSHASKRPQTAVDRAVNFGKDIPSYLLPRTKDPREKQARRDSANKTSDPRLAALYDDGLVSRLGGGGFA